MLFNHSKSRLEALSDGVFAFASTLLVVNVGLDTNVVSFNEELPNFISFGVSFFVMMGIWFCHYKFFRRTDYVDNWIIVLNMILLFTVLFYIFPIKSLIGSSIGGERITIEKFSQIFQLYSIGFAIIFGALSLMYVRAYKKENSTNKILLFYARHFGIFVLVGVISFILAKLNLGLKYGTPGFIYFFLGILCWIHSVKFFKKHPIN